MLHKKCVHHEIKSNVYAAFEASTQQIAPSHYVKLNAGFSFFGAAERINCTKSGSKPYP